MILAFGGLVALSVGTVLAISVAANFANTFSLLGAQSIQTIEGIEHSIRSQTLQAEQTVEGLAKLYQDNEFEIGDAQSQRDILKSVLLTSRVVETLLVYDAQGWRSGLFRTVEGHLIDLPWEPASEAEIGSGFHELMESEEPAAAWGEPVFVDDILFHSVGYPLIKDGQLKGAVVAAVGRHTVNRFVVELGRQNDATVFVMDGNQAVVAHSRLPQVFKGKPNIPLSEFPDPALREIANAEPLDDPENHMPQGMTVYESGGEESEGQRGPDGHVFITRQLTNFALDPYTIGIYYNKADIGTEIMRAVRSAIAGVVALALAVLAAIFIARWLSRPLHNIAAAATRYSQLDLVDDRPLPRSRVREIDEQAVAMNSMHTALSQFSQYVPKTLVARLLSSGTEATRSVEREVTILFSDIVGFTALSEHMNAAETAAALNEHFDLVSTCIGECRGTVDKFMGDGVMAFWGAPEADDNQAAHAIEAAHHMVQAVSAENRRREQVGKKPLAMRIGIHTGRAVVGNIGGGERHNYTVVGDTVNVANRLEQLGKELIGDEEAVVLVSAATRQSAGDPASLVPAGSHDLRGRAGPISVYMLDIHGTARPENIVAFPGTA